MKFCLQLTCNSTGNITVYSFVVGVLFAIQALQLDWAPGGWFVDIKGLHLMMPCWVIWKKKLGSLSWTPHYWICLKVQYLHLYGYLWNLSLLADCVISYISTYLECVKVGNTFRLLQTLILVWKMGNTFIVSCNVDISMWNFPFLCGKECKTSILMLSPQIWVCDKGQFLHFITNLCTCVW